MGCALCKSVKSIEINTNDLKNTLDATQKTLIEAEVKISTLETSVAAITSQVVDVRADLAKLIKVMEVQVPHLANTVELMKKEVAGSSISGGVAGIGNTIGGLFTPWASVEVPKPPTVTIEVNAPHSSEKPAPPPPKPAPAAPEDVAPVDVQEEVIEELVEEDPAPKKKVLKTKKVKKAAPPPPADE